MYNLGVCFTVVLFGLLVGVEPSSAGEYVIPIQLGNSWQHNGRNIVEGSCTVLLDKSYKKGKLQFNITFSKPTSKMKIWKANILSRSPSRDWYQVENKNREHPPQLKIRFQLYYKGSMPTGVCYSPVSGTTTQVPTTTTTQSPKTTTQIVTTEAPVTTTTEKSVTSSLAPTTSSVVGSCGVEAEVGSVWPVDPHYRMDAWCNIPVTNTLPEETVTLKLLLSKPTSNLMQWTGNLVSSATDGTWYKFTNMDNQHPPVWRFNFQLTFSGQNPPIGICVIGDGNYTPQPTTQNPTTVAPTTREPSTSRQPQTTEKPVTTTRAGTTNVQTTQKPITTTGAQTTNEPISTTKTVTSQAPVTTTKIVTTQKPATTNAPTTVKPNTKYDYGDVISKSIMFYEAQRSGKLPSNNRVPWRKDSAENDGQDVGRNLTGGWYDAGDHVKFNFPMAASTTVLAWGLVQWEDAYKAAGQYQIMLDSIKWPLDYFLRCWNAKTKEYYAQVGDGHKDHAFWGRPEDMTMNRPSFKVDTNNPGSDVAAETAAAFVIGSKAFKATDPSYSEELLNAARSLYDFAVTYKKKYSDSIPNAASFYQSYSGYNDELFFAAAMMFAVTNEQKYLTDAKNVYSSTDLAGKNAVFFSWDDKLVAGQLLMYEKEGESQYKSKVEAFVDRYMGTANGMQQTPGGLAWSDQWGALRYTANAAFIALLAADAGIKTNTYRQWAESQINYMLGDNPRSSSYVIGFGNNYPKKPHHRSSSCPNKPAICDWNSYNAPGDNPHVLVGALVGGPDTNDNYVDDRKDYIMNEVACDYNAGFQSAVAGLLDDALTN